MINTTVSLHICIYIYISLKTDAQYDYSTLLICIFLGGGGCMWGVFWWYFWRCLGVLWRHVRGISRGFQRVNIKDHFKNNNVPILIFNIISFVICLISRCGYIFAPHIGGILLTAYRPFEGLNMLAWIVEFRPGNKTIWVVFDEESEFVCPRTYFLHPGRVL